MDSRLETGDPPRISVVIPTYNRAGIVCRAIESALGQAFAPSEIIVVDDGSKDDTRSRVEAYGRRLRYVYQDNAGAAAARNRGASEAREAWVAFLDSDDVWAPSYLERMAAAILATAGSAALYFSDAEFEGYPPPKNRWARAGFSARVPYDLIVDPRAVVFAESQPMLLPFSVFKRSTFLEAGGLWERLPAAEDTHLFTRLGLTHAICAVSVLGGVVKGAEEQRHRLTGTHGPSAVTHWECAVLMWSDILRRSPDLSPAYRRLLTRRIADAYWRKALLCAKQGMLLTAAESLRQSLRHDASVARQATARKLGWK
jgi:hypothetical protein